MKGVHVLGIYLLLSTIVMFILLVIPGAPATFQFWPFSLSTLGFVILLPQSVEFILIGGLFGISQLPAAFSVVILIIDFILGLGLMLLD